MREPVDSDAPSKALSWRERRVTVSPLRHEEDGTGLLVVTAER